MGYTSTSTVYNLFFRVLVDRVNELERRLLEKRQGAGSGVGSQGEAVQDLPLAAQELMDGYTPPAGRGGLAHIKDEDISLDPRLARFLGPLTSQTSHAGAGGEQLNGIEEGNNITENQMQSKTNLENQSEDVVSGAESENQTSEECVTETNLARESIEDTDEEEEKEATPLLSDLHSQTCTDDALEEIVPLDQLDAYIKEVHMKRQRTQKGQAKKEEKKCKEKGNETNIKEKETKGKEAVDRRSETEPKCEEREKRGSKSRERKESQSEPDESEAGTREEKKRNKCGEIIKVQETNMVTSEEETVMKDTANADKNEDDDDDSFDLDLSDYDSDNDKLDLALEEWRNDCGGKLVEQTSPAKDSKRDKGGKRDGFRLWRKEPKETDMEIPSALKALLDKATASVDGGSDSNSGWTM